MRPIEGKDVLVSILVEGEFLPVMCAIEMSFQCSQEVLLSTTIDTGIWRRKRLRQLSEWSVTVTGITKIDNTDGQASFFYLLQENIRSQEQTIQMMFEDEDGNTQVLEGVVVIPELSLTANMTGFMDTSITFEGAGDVGIEPVVSGGGNGSGESGESGECDVLFSDTWLMAEGETTITGPGNEGRSFAGKEILQVAREGMQYDYTNGTPGNREFGFDGTTITFRDPSAGETVFVLWK